MKFDSKRGKGRSRSVILALILLGAGGGTYAIARRTPAPDPAGPVTTAVLTQAGEKREEPRPAEKVPDKLGATEKPAGFPRSAATAPKPAGAEKADAKGVPGPRPATSSEDLARWIQEGKAALAKGDDRAGGLLLRKAARVRGGGPEATEAADELARIAAAALDAASKAKDDAAAERVALSRAFFATLDREARKPLRERLDDLAKRTTFSPRCVSDGDVYTVKQGDKLIQIARSHRTTWAFIKRVNGLKTDAIRVGQKLKIPRGTVEMAVWKTDFQLVATIGGVYLKAFDVGTGREDRTPESTFKIAERLEKPTWYAPDGKVYPFGTKENILGTRWMGFERTDEFAGFGIHGTALPETIGTESSAGCIRMRNEDVEELYDFVNEGTTVTIVR